MIPCKIVDHLMVMVNMKTYELKGYTLVLDKIVFVSAVFTANHEEGKQFNVRMIGDLLKFKFPKHEDAVLARQLLIKAIKEE